MTTYVVAFVRQLAPVILFTYYQVPTRSPTCMNPLVVEQWSIK